ncbi:hypothetical protein [Streptomyces sp. L-9-10]|uniref:hypothetical protein n=1 Tax=Streptomyces sp. L-9-10 TaxID=1478131 RepID=UPI00101CAC85|nr:hypothetical protein [Streptomyces sp. L-9-10]
MCEQDTSDPPTAASSPPSSPPSSRSPAAGTSSRSVPAPHETTTVERGSFCTARCTCGWSGHARRSRDLARTDAAAHATAQPPARTPTRTTKS